MDKALQQKFKIKPTTTIIMVNAPTEYNFAQTGTTEKIIIAFIKVKQEVKTLVSKYVKGALTESLSLWCAYPKKSSGIKSDITRDSGWDYLTDNGLEIVSIISIDETWSAVRFKKKPENAKKPAKTTDRKVELPEVLSKLLHENAACKKFFESLSYSNQKEYISWINTAKRQETVDKRVAQIKLKLLLGKKNPSEK